MTRLQRTAGNRAVVRMLQREVAAETWSQSELDAVMATNRARTMAVHGDDPQAVAAAKREAIVKLALSEAK